jgi:uncharacterized protein YukE
VASTVTVNPFVASRIDQPTDAWSGVWIAEDIELIAQGIENGSWIDGTLGVVGAGLDALALISDPIGVLLQYGVSWLIEHVKPLTEALDWLAGDPGEISGQAQTWRNIAAGLRDSSDQTDRAVRFDTAEWEGSAGDAYRAWGADVTGALTGLSAAAETMSVIIEAAGALIAAVRILVRDAIATLVSRLITYAAEELFSFGVATPLVVEQATTLIASWAAKISRWLRGLLSSLRRLFPAAERIGHHIEELKKLLSRLLKRGEGGAGTHPSGKPDPNGAPRGRRTDAHPTRVKDRPLRRENESADTLAKNGYDVEQNPPPKPNGKEPDYKIEGEYFDCYSPDSTNIEQIRKGISRKVSADQADRIILNLDDCPRSMQEIEDILRRKPIDGLSEIKIVKDGQVLPFYPFS